MNTQLLQSVFGSNGFIGKEICKNPNFIHNEDDEFDKHHYPSKTPDFVYLISTVHNYNVLDNNPYVDIETNLNHLITTLQSNRMKYGNDFTITFVSSWFVYGKTECPAKEESICMPSGFYSITKHTAEQLLKSYCETFGIKYKIVRLSNVMGIGDEKISRRKNALQYIIKTLCSGGEIELYKDDCMRDYIHVSDAAEAIRRIARSEKFCETYNVGSGTPSSIHGLVNYSHTLCGSGTIKLIETPEFHKQVQVKDMWLDVTKIKNDLGWEATMTPKSVVEDLVEYYMKDG